jgi:CBS domain-containing protein
MDAAGERLLYDEMRRSEAITKDPVCCLPNDSVAKAAELMKSENNGSIPVIENEQSQKLVGIHQHRLAYGHRTTRQWQLP